MTATDNAPLLANSALFVDLAPKALQFLAERATRLEFERGRHIFRQGDEGDSLYVIAEGLVKVWVSSGTAARWCSQPCDRPTPSES